MEFSEKWGKDIDTATELALKDLKCTIDEVDVEVLEQPSKGFLGIGSKLAKVRVTKKEDKKESRLQKLNIVEEDGVYDKETEEKIKNLKEDEYIVIKDVDEPTVVLDEDTEILIGDPVEEHEALDFLKDITSKMGLDLNFVALKNNDGLHIDISGKDAATIIGKRGRTLDAIQYLTSLAVNKGKDEYLKIVLDAENYRAKREETLKRLAERLAQKAIRTNRTVRIEPMNPYERMVIHATLQNNEKVMTRSEGEEPYRRVVIEVKK